VTTIEEEDMGTSFCVHEDDAVREHYALAVNSFGQYDILCDSQSDVHIFKEASLLSNIRAADRPLRVAGMGGSIIANQVGDLQEIGPIYFHPNSVANILSFGRLRDSHSAGYNNDHDYFYVNCNDTEWKFMRRPEGDHYIYNANGLVYDIDNGTTAAMSTKCSSTSHMELKVSLVTTVAERESVYSKRELADMHEAMRIRRVLGNPSLHDMVAALKNGAINNCKVPAEAFVLAEKVYGKDMASLKGKTVKRASPIVKTSDLLMELHNEIRDIVLCVDLFFISGLTFLLSVSRKMNLLMVRYIASKERNSIKLALDKIISTYNSRRFTISAIVCDGEGAVAALRTEIEAKGITVNLTAKSEHVPEIERAGRQMKERVRGFWNTLPYKLTALLIIYLVYYCVSTINMFPKRSMVGSGAISPRELFLGRKTDVKVECRVAFGEYVQAHEDLDVTNTMAERTIGAIVLGPSGNVQGSYDLLSLKTWKVVRRNHFTHLPMPNLVISAINAKAAEDVLAVSLKDAVFKNSMQQEIDDSTDLADEMSGVPVYNRHHATGGHGKELPLLQTDRSIQQIVASSDDKQDDVALLVNDAPDNVDHMDMNDDIVYNDDTNALIPIDDKNAFIPPNDHVVDDTPIQQEDILAIGDVVEQGDVIKDLQDIQACNRYNLRPRKHNWQTRYEEAVALTNISHRKAIKEIGLEAAVSMMTEMAQMHSKKVFEPVQYTMLDAQQRSKVVRSHLFMKRKRDGRLKSRLVVDGRTQDRVEAGDIASPTVSIEAIFATAVIDASEHRQVLTIDIEGAYLHAQMEDEVIMELEPALADIMVTIDSTYSEYVTGRGKIYVKLIKALYGCIQSALLFNKHVTNVLVNIGYTCNRYDACVLNKTVGGKQITVAIYVDDLKVSSVDKGLIEELIGELKRVYKNISVNKGTTVQYLGMLFDYTIADEVTVRMDAGYLQELMDEWDIVQSSPTPAAANLFDIDTSSKLLGELDRKKYHSTVQKLLYLSKRARPDILTAVAFHTTRVKAPTLQDQKKLIRVLNYLYGSMNLPLRLSAASGSGVCTVTAYVDASYGVHSNDGKGHSGILTSIGSGPVFAKSSKQKLVARSSTEAELIALSDATCQVLWMRNFLADQGLTVGPAIIKQDNMSTIAMAKKGKSTSKRTKHIAIRYFFVKDRIESNEIKVEYLNTDDMVADILTKPLQGAKFFKLRALLMNEKVHIAGVCW
jgi:hypothetical protein